MKKDEEKTKNSKDNPRRLKKILIFSFWIMLFSFLELYGILWFPNMAPPWTKVLYNILVPISFLIICYIHVVVDFIICYLNSMEDETSVEEDIESTFSKEGVL